MEIDIRTTKYLLPKSEVGDHSDQSFQQRPNVEHLASMWKCDQSMEARGAYSAPKQGKKCSSRLLCGLDFQLATKES